MGNDGNCKSRRPSWIWTGTPQAMFKLTGAKRRFKTSDLPHAYRIFKPIEGEDLFHRAPEICPLGNSMIGLSKTYSLNTLQIGRAPSLGQRKDRGIVLGGHGQMTQMLCCFLALDSALAGLSGHLLSLGQHAWHARGSCMRCTLNPAVMAVMAVMRSGSF